MAVTKQEIKAALTGVQAVAEAIRELGEVPSGHLYAQLTGVMDLRTYESIIGLLKRTELVSESGNLLKWTGPAIDRAKEEAEWLEDMPYSRANSRRKAG